MGVGWPGVGSWTFLLATVSSSFGILSRRKYFPVSSLQILTRSQLQVGSAFLLSGITMNSILEPLVTHLLQHLIDSLVGGALGQGGPGERRKGDGGRGSLQRLWGNSPGSGKAVKQNVLDTAICVGYRQGSYFWGALEAGGVMVTCWLGEQKQCTILPWLQGKPSRLLLCNFHGSHS